MLVQANDWTATQCKPSAQQSAPTVTMRTTCRSTSARLALAVFDVNHCLLRLSEQMSHCLRRGKLSSQFARSEAIAASFRLENLFLLRSFSCRFLALQQRHR